MKKFFSSILPYAIILAIILLISGGIRLVDVIRSSTEDGVSITGGALRLTGHFAATEEGLFFTRTSWDSEGIFSHTLYRLNEDGSQEQVGPLPGGSFWSSADQRYFYLADSKTLAAFDPITGEVITRALSQEYNSLIAAEDGFVCLISASAEVIVYSLADGQERNTGLEGYPDGIFSGQLLMWDYKKAVLHRYNCGSGELLAPLDLSAHWPSGSGNAPTLYVTQGDLYLFPGAYLNSNRILVIPGFVGGETEVKTLTVGKAGQYVFDMVEADGQLIFMVKRLSLTGLDFLALNTDGSFTKLAEWPEMQDYRGGDYVWMGTFGGKLYAIQSLMDAERGIFSFPLPAS